MGRVCRFCRAIVSKEKSTHLFSGSSASNDTKSTQQQQPWLSRIEKLLDMAVDLGISLYMCNTCKERVVNLENALLDLEAFRKLAELSRQALMRISASASKRSSSSSSRDVSASFEKSSADYEGYSSFSGGTLKNTVRRKRSRSNKEHERAFSTPSSPTLESPPPPPQRRALTPQPMRRSRRRRRAHHSADSLGNQAKQKPLQPGMAFHSMDVSQVSLAPPCSEAESIASSPWSESTSASSATLEAKSTQALSEESSAATLAIEESTSTQQALASPECSLEPEAPAKSRSTQTIITTSEGSLAVPFASPPTHNEAISTQTSAKVKSAQTSVEEKSAQTSAEAKSTQTSESSMSSVSTSPAISEAKSTNGVSMPIQAAPPQVEEKSDTKPVLTIDENEAAGPKSIQVENEMPVKAEPASIHSSPSTFEVDSSSSTSTAEQSKQSVLDPASVIQTTGQEEPVLLSVEGKTTLVSQAPVLNPDIMETPDDSSESSGSLYEDAPDTGIDLSDFLHIHSADKSAEKELSRVVKHIIEKGEDVDQISANDGLSPLMAASVEGNEFMAELLLTVGKASVNNVNHDGQSALMMASKKDRAGVAKLLLRHGAEVDLQDNDGSSALMFAVEAGSLAIVLHLLRHGADPDLQRVDWESPLSLALQGGYSDVLEAIDCMQDIDMEKILQVTKDMSTVITDRIEEAISHFISKLPSLPPATVPLQESAAQKEDSTSSPPPSTSVPQTAFSKEPTQSHIQPTDFFPYPHWPSIPFSWPSWLCCGPLPPVSLPPAAMMWPHSHLHPYSQHQHQNQGQHMGVPSPPTPTLWPCLFLGHPNSQPGCGCEVHLVELRSDQGTSDGGFGFEICGGSEQNSPLYVREVRQTRRPSGQEGNLKVGDKIQKINGKSAEQMSLSDANLLINGSPNVVTLLVERLPTEKVPKFGQPSWPSQYWNPFPAGVGTQHTMSPQTQGPPKPQQDVSQQHSQQPKESVRPTESQSSAGVPPESSQLPAADLSQSPAADVPESLSPASLHLSRSAAISVKLQPLKEIIQQEVMIVSTDQPKEPPWLTPKAKSTPLCMGTLILIKWRDSDGRQRKFHLVKKVSHKWRMFGFRFQRGNNEMDALEEECSRKSEQCWIKVMSEWLDEEGTEEYPATWEGILLVLEDVELSTIAKQLRKVLSNVYT